MADLQAIEQELREFLVNERGMLFQEKLAKLMNIFTKHLDFDKTEHTIRYQDMFQIIGEAKRISGDSPLDIKISNQLLEFNELRHLFMIEAFMTYLYRKKLLNKPIKIEYTDK